MSHMTEPTTTNNNIKVNARGTPSLYVTSVIHHVTHLSMNDISHDIKRVLQESVARDIEGKCGVYGFIRPDSCAVISYSSGKIRGTMIRYDITVECKICNPPEGMFVKCNVDSVTKVGIRATAIDKYSPLVVFVSRDHMRSGESFDDIMVNQTVNINIVGTRFELGDPNVSAIGVLLHEEK